MRSLDIFDLHRMDDDGAPPPADPGILPFRVGIPAEPVAADPFDEFAAEPAILKMPEPEREPVILKDVRPERAPRSRPAPYIPGQGDIPAEPPALVSADGEPLGDPLTWDAYLAWRKSKCRPYDREAYFALKATGPDGESLGGWKNHRVLEEVDQATLEVIGEVAEIGELFEQSGPATFFGARRTKLIDECGDVIFCACWAMDAWGVNPLYGTDSLELVILPPEHIFHPLAGILLTEDPEQIIASSVSDTLYGIVSNLTLSAATAVGLTANAYKKLRYQRREQDPELQAGRVGVALLAVNHLLILIGSSMEEAMRSNMRKLNARFPEGYQSGVGGGIRTGEGA